MATARRKIILDNNMDGLPYVIPKSIVEVLNRVENDEDHQFFWKLTRSDDTFSLTISCKLDNSRVGAKTQNNATVEKTGRYAEKPVNRSRNKSPQPRVAVKPMRRRRKKKSPSKLRRSRERRKRFLERKKSAGKPDLASPKEKEDSVNSVNSCQELKIDSLSTGSDLDLTSRGQKSQEIPTSGTISDADLLEPVVEQEILREFLDTCDIDSDDDVCVSVCALCKHQPKEGEDLLCCSRCRITQYCSLSCQRKDEDFHRFACGVGSLQASH